MSCFTYRSCQVLVRIGRISIGLPVHHSAGRLATVRQRTSVRSAQRHENNPVNFTGREFVKRCVDGRVVGRTGRKLRQRSSSLFKFFNTFFAFQPSRGGRPRRGHLQKKSEDCGLYTSARTTPDDVTGRRDHPGYWCNMPSVARMLGFTMEPVDLVGARN